LRRPIFEIIKERYSCRTYVNQPIQASEQRALSEFLASNRSGPLGSRSRLALVAASDQDRASLKGLGTYGFIKGATGFMVGAVERAPKDLEDYGYRMEHAVLFATDLGLGTCWLGGTFTKSRFAEKIEVTRAERVPAVAAVGYVAEDSGFRDRIRVRVGAKDRLAGEQLFFDGSFGVPMAPDQTGAYREVLEAVRWAPSASNKQPWRIVRTGDDFHFYLQRTRGYGKGSLIFSLLRLSDLQRVDMGIAMCHFELTAGELGLTGHWAVDEPRIRKPDGSTEYTVSWRTVAR
jgi:hypothetical protein